MNEPVENHEESGQKVISGIEDTAAVRDARGRFVPGHPVLAISPGRPKGNVSITEGIRRRLAEIEPGERKTTLERILDVLIEKALVEKNERVLKEIWNYIDGMPKATLGLGMDKENLADLTQFFRKMAIGNGEAIPSTETTPA